MLLQKRFYYISVFFKLFYKTSLTIGHKYEAPNEDQIH